MKKYSFYMMLTLVFTACVDNIVYFDQPQPNQINDLEVLPFWYRGTYISADSSLLFIDKQKIIRHTNYSLTYSKQDIDNSQEVSLENNILMDKSTHEKIVFTRINDTIYTKEIQIDTLFNLSQGNIARKYKGYLILNIKHDNLWRVEILDLKWKTVRHSNVVSKELFNELARTSESEVLTDSTKTDTLQMILKPSKKEFKDLLHAGSLSFIKEYKKVKYVN